MRGLFRILDDSCGQAVTEAGLHDPHVKLETLHSALQSAIDTFQQDQSAENKLAIARLYAQAEKLNLGHMKQEEQVMVKRIEEIAMKGSNLQMLVQEILCMTQARWVRALVEGAVVVSPYG